MKERENARAWGWARLCPRRDRTGILLRSLKSKRPFQRTDRTIIRKRICTVNSKSKREHRALSAFSLEGTVRSLCLVRHRQLLLQIGKFLGIQLRINLLNPILTQRQTKHNP